MSLKLFDQLAVAIVTEVMERPGLPRVLARVGDEFFKLQRFEAREGGGFDTEWSLQSDQYGVLAAWVDPDDSDYPLGQVQG